MHRYNHMIFQIMSRKYCPLEIFWKVANFSEINDNGVILFIGNLRFYECAITLILVQIYWNIHGAIYLPIESKLQNQ